MPPPPAPSPTKRHRENDDDNNDDNNDDTSTAKRSRNEKRHSTSSRNFSEKTRDDLFALYQCARCWCCHTESPSPETAHVVPKRDANVS
jgi:hypothetical protein